MKAHRETSVRGEKIEKKVQRARRDAPGMEKWPPPPARSPCCSRSTPGTARSPGQRGPRPPRGRTSHPCRGRGRGPRLELAGAATRLLAAARSTVGDARPGAPRDSARVVGLEGCRAGAADEPGSCGRRTQRRGHASRGRAGGGPGDAPHRDTEAGCARAGRPGHRAQRGDPGRPASSGARRG